MRQLRLLVCDSGLILQVDENELNVYICTLHASVGSMLEIIAAKC